MTKFFLLKTFEDAGFKEIDLSDLKQQIQRIDTAQIKIGLDIHGGFNIPSYDELKELLLEFKKREVEIHFSLIDQRAQSADLPYSPNKIFIKKDNKILRKNIYSRRSVYISKLPLEKEIILNNYKEILGEEYRRFRGDLEKSINTSATLGEFLFKLNCLIISKKLKEFKKIHLKSKFDVFNENNQEFHPISTHTSQHIIYIALHRAIYDKDELKYLENKFKKAFSGELKYIILPMNPNSYFTI